MALPSSSNLVNAERVSVSFGLDPVLREVSLGVSGGDRIGIVGRNGGGKSTLMSVLAGIRAPDSGRVSRTAGVTVGVVRQDDDLDDAGSVRDNVFADRALHDWAGEARIRDVVTGLLGPLGGGAVDLDAAVTAMSGGERRRITLARELVRRPDLLLLDEPTNHLDVEGVAWLADHLVTRASSPDSAIVVITHDRWFLDAVATRTWEVVSGEVTPFDGGYAAYVLAKAERERVAEVTAERRSNLLRKELAWLRRGPPARTTKPKFRIDAANALIDAEPPPRDNAELLRFATARLGKDVVDLHDVSVAVPAEAGGRRTLLDRVTWLLAPGDRVGIVGVNGAGKSTLLRVIAGELPVTAGKRKQGVTVSIGHLTQDVTMLDRFADWRVIDAVEDVRSFVRLGAKELSAAQVAQRLGFSGPAQQTRVGDLSGGERRRLQLTRILMAEPNLLLLDEPTNDLDIETLTSLEDVLDGWAGTLLVVSHDRYLLERVCDRQVALLGDGRVRDLPGGVEEYLRLRKEIVASLAAPVLAGPAVGAAGDAAGDAAARVTAAALGPSAAEQREARKAMARAERQLSRLAERERRVHEAMAEAAADHARALELNRELREIVDEREVLELEWLDAAEVVE